MGGLLLEIGLANRSLGIILDNSKEVTYSLVTLKVCLTTGKDSIMRLIESFNRNDWNVIKGDDGATLISRPTRLEVSADINIRAGKCQMTLNPGGASRDLAEVTFAFDPESSIDEVVDGILSSIGEPVANFDNYIVDYRYPFAFLMNTELEKNRRTFSRELKRGLSDNFVSVKVDMI